MNYLAFKVVFSQEKCLLNFVLRAISTTPVVALTAGSVTVVKTLLSFHTRKNEDWW